MDDGKQIQRPAMLADLLARCALRDQRAFVALYEATSAKLFGVVLRILGREAWAEEALQEAYLKIWNGAGSYNAARGRPMTWMINIARHQALDLTRRAEFRRSEPNVPLDENLPASGTPLQATETHSELRRLTHCMETLADNQRECILLVYHQGFTPTEVAHRRSWPVGTVKTWIRRGLERVRTCLGQ